MNEEFSKSERKQLRTLAGEVYEADAALILTELESSFKNWRAGTLETWELLQAIHEFHQVQSRQLWSRHQVLKSPDIVARGIALGRIDANRVAPELLEKLRPTIAAFESFS